MYKKFNKYYMADDGTNGASGANPPEPPAEGGEGEAFTPEQQAQIEALINKAYAKGAAKAAKEAEAKAAREKQTEAERLAADRAELENEKARLKAQTLLAKEGFVLGDDTDEALIGLFAATSDAAESNLAALKKLIDAKVNQEVDKRLKGAGTPAPQNGNDKKTVNDTINGLFRQIKK